LLYGLKLVVPFGLYHRSFEHCVVRFIESAVAAAAVVVVVVVFVFVVVVVVRHISGCLHLWNNCFVVRVFEMQYLLQRSQS
jgi:hypothetical protein